MTMNDPTKPRYKVLSIDGGGFLGLATAAFIQGIEKHENVRFSDTFDLFCGTSTGSIIALALADGKSGSDLVNLYQELGPNVFPTNRITGWARILRSLVWAKYGNKPLRKALNNEFGTRTIGDLRTNDKHALVPSFNLSTGYPRIFKTDHSTQLSRDDDYSLVDVIMASTAAPTFLPIVKLTHPSDGSVENFCDGGVAANHPALLGFTEATYELGHAPGTVQVLSISTPRQDLSVRRVQFSSRGILQWASKLGAIFTDSNSFLAHELMQRLMVTYPDPKPRYERIELKNPHRLPMDCTSKAAAENLIQHGAAAASSNKIRDQVRPFLKGD